MRFECDSCHAKYKISDEKVAGRVVRFPCRKCDHKILIDGRLDDVTVPAGPAYGYEEVTRRSEPAPFGKEPATARRRPANPVRRRQSSVPPRRPASVARRMSSSPAAAASAFLGQHPGLAPPLPASTSTGQSPLLARKADPAEWHVSINDVPIGPIRLEEMAHKVDAGAVSEYSLVWREGFDEWRPLATVPELMSLLYQRRSSGPPTRSRFSSMPPFVEAQTAIKETPEAKSMPPGPPKAPVHALSDTMGMEAAAEFLPLADALQPEASLPAALGELSQPPAILGPEPQMFEPQMLEPQMPEPEIIESAPPPSGAFSGLPQPPNEPVSVPAVPPQPVVEQSRSGSSPWIWILLVAVAAFAGAAGMMVVDRWGDEIMDRVLGPQPDPIEPGVRAVQPILPPEPVEEAVVEEEVVVESEETEALAEEIVAEDEAVAIADAEEEIAAEDALEDSLEEVEPDPPAAIEPPKPPASRPTVKAAKPRRRARPKRTAKPASSTSGSPGIKKLGGSSLSAEEEKLLADFGSGSKSGVAKIDVKDASSARAKRDALDSKAVSSTVTVNKPRLQRCYERAIRGQQSPTAVRMNVSVNVAPSGRVSDVSVAGKGPGGLKECMEASIRRWRFPASSEGGPAKFPIVFSAN